MLLCHAMLCCAVLAAQEPLAGERQLSLLTPGSHTIGL